MEEVLLSRRDEKEYLFTLGGEERGEGKGGEGRGGECKAYTPGWKGTRVYAVLCVIMAIIHILLYAYFHA